MPKLRDQKSGLPDRLREILRDEFVAVCDEFGRARPRDICRRAIEAFPAEITPHLQDWGRARFVELASREFKTFGSLASVGLRQATLPGLEESLIRNLPVIVTVPVVDEASDDDFDHIPAERATPTDWRAHRDQVLRPQRDGLSDAIINVDELLERGEGCPDNDALLPWLSSQAARAAAQARPPDPG